MRLFYFVSLLSFVCFGEFLETDSILGNNHLIQINDTVSLKVIPNAINPVALLVKDSADSKIKTWPLDSISGLKLTDEPDGAVLSVYGDSLFGNNRFTNSSTGQLSLKGAVVGYGYPPYLWMIDSANGSEWDTWFEGATLYITQLKSLMYKRGKSYTSRQTQFGVLRKYFTPGNDTIWHSLIGFCVPFCTKASSYWGHNLAAYVDDSTGQLHLNKKEFGSGSSTIDTFPAIMYGKLNIKKSLDIDSVPAISMTDTVPIIRGDGLVGRISASSFRTGIGAATPQQISDSIGTHIHKRTDTLVIMFGSDSLCFKAITP